MQMLKSPYNFDLYQLNPKRWSPVILIGGGFNLKLQERIRLTAGLFYDIINSQNSPFRSSYNFKVKDQNGGTIRYLPIIYRLTFFFPLGEKVK
jgi:hypothetical protein